MDVFSDLRQRIDSSFSEITFPVHPAHLYEPISYTLQLGGKRLRPLFVMASCQMFGGDLNDAINPAIGLELFHNFTLLHDDIMDNAPLRRGKPTVFKKWDPNIAILSGDTLFAISNRYMLRTHAQAIPLLMDLFTQTAIEVCEGQQLDMDFEAQEVVSIPDYIEMIRLKTAVLLAASLKTGAIVAHASQPDCSAIQAFGQYVGLAFQLKDDLLDVYGSADKFGKRTGGDIIEGKKTYLYLKALEMLGPAAPGFRGLYSNRSIPEAEKISEVKAVFGTLQIEAITRRLIDQYYSMALSELDKLSLPREATESLREYTDWLMVRDS